MKSEADELRRLFRGILMALAVPVVGCSTNVVTSTQDASVSTDVAATADVPVVTDAPVFNDVPVVTDRPTMTTDVPTMTTDVPTMTTDRPTMSPDLPVMSPDVPAMTTDVPVVMADVSAPGDTGCAVVPTISTCAERVTYSCGIAELPDGMENVALTMDQCARLCAPAFPNGDRPFACNAYRSSPGARAVIVNCATCAIGRRTQGFAALATDGGDEVGRYFAAAAQLEAASVVAFRTLGAELAAHGAPASLVRDAARAAEEERRHARITRALARARGAEVPPVVLPEVAPRDRAALARENAVEGCVRETFGALVAHYQRERAEDPAVRVVMDVIADDETRHAALAWSVAAWLDGVLDADTRASVRAARDAAVESLAQELQQEVPASLVREAGMPPREVALAMLQGLRDARWAQA
jgi:hypothetical protein